MAKLSVSFLFWQLLQILKKKVLNMYKLVFKLAQIARTMNNIHVYKKP